MKLVWQQWLQRQEIYSVMLNKAVQRQGNHFYPSCSQLLFQSGGI